MAQYVDSEIIKLIGQCSKQELLNWKNDLTDALNFGEVEGIKYVQELELVESRLEPIPYNNILNQG